MLGRVDPVVADDAPQLRDQPGEVGGGGALRRPLDLRRPFRGGAFDYGTIHPSTDVDCR